MSFPRTIHRVGFLCVALCALLTGTPGCSPTGGTVILHPEPGLPRYQRSAAVPVPGGIVNTVGGNLMVPRIDLSIETRLGRRDVGAVYNSATQVWRWSFEIYYDGIQLVDSDGAKYNCTFVANGDLIPGSAWTRIDATRVRSLGGLVHEFGFGGRLTAIHWASGDYPRLEYTSQAVAGVLRLTQVQQCRAPGECEDVYTVSHDYFGNITAIEDRAGRQALFEHDGIGNTVSARDPLDVARGWPGRRYEYSSRRLRAVTNSEGERIEFETATVLKSIETVRKVGNPDRVHHFTYDHVYPLTTVNQASRIVRHHDPLGNTTEYRTDGFRRPGEIHLPSGDTIIRRWNGGQLASISTPDGNTTSWTFVSEDEIHRHEPSGNTVRIQYNSTGVENRANPFERPIQSIEDDLGSVESRGYQDGRLVWIENGAGERTDIDYDAHNQIASIAPPDGTVLGFADYGEHGQPETLTGGGETETRIYDAVGNLVSAAGFDALDFRPGGEIAYVYDADRNVAEIVLADAPFGENPAEQSVTIDYRSDGRPVRITRPHGGDHEFVYNAHGNLIERRERIDGAWQTTHFEVDELGRRTAETLPNGMRREVAYDPDGRIAAQRAWRANTLEAEAIYGWAGGRLVSIEDAAYGAAETFSYDAGGSLASIQFPGGERLDLERDLRGRRTGETYVLPGGSALRSLGFGYDAAGRPAALEDGGNPLLDQSFVDGRLEQIAYGNGLVRNFDYDAATGLLEATTLDHPHHGPVEVTSVTRNLVSVPPALELVATTVTAGPATATTREEHLLGPAAGSSADEGKRLLGWSDGQTIRDYAYDALSNVTESENGDLVHVYNAERNRLLRIDDAATGESVVAYAYDAAGYATARAGASVAWTAQGHVAAFGADQFEWDAQGRPTRRVVGGVERHFRFGGRVETDAAGTPVRIDLRAVVLELETSTTRYRHTDYRGNVKLVSDDAGDIVAHYAYAAYGVESLVGSDDEAASFAGGRGVGELVLLGSRLHDPLAARFLAPDPIFQLLSQFTYTAGNPVTWWDPSGRYAIPGPAQGRAFNMAQMNVVEAAADAAAGPAGQAAVGLALIAIGAHLTVTFPVGGTAAGGPLIGTGVLIIWNVIQEAAAEAIMGWKGRRGSGRGGGESGGSNTSPSPDYDVAPVPGFDTGGSFGGGINPGIGGATGGGFY